MRQIGMELIVEKKAAIMSEISGGKEKYGGRGGARDLLTLLLKANMATDIPDNQRLSDEDVLARTFFSLLVLYRQTEVRHSEVPTYVDFQNT